MAEQNHDNMSVTEPQHDLIASARSRFQYSLRTLLCLPVILALFLGLGSVLAARHGVLIGWTEAWFILGLVVTAIGIWKRHWICLVGVLVMVLNIPGIQVPPRGLTDARMWVIKRRILQYAHAHNALPASIKDLPIFSGYDNEIADAWGREIRYEIHSDKVALTSFGRDGTPGGTGDDADMIGIFVTKDGKGNWQQELSDWTRSPFSCAEPGDSSSK